MGIVDTFGIGSLQATVDKTFAELVDEWITDPTINLTPEFAITEFEKYDAYRERFAAIYGPNGNVQLRPGQVVEYENRARAMFQAADLPPGFYDETSDFADFIGLGTSLEELGARIADVSRWIDENRADFLEVAQQDYGLSRGDLLAMTLDAERGFDAVQRRSNQIRLSGQAQRQGFSITKQFASELTSEGVRAEESAPLFGQAALQSGLVTDDLTQQEIVEAKLGRAPAAQKVRRRVGEIEASVSGGGSFARTRDGRESLS